MKVLHIIMKTLFNNMFSLLGWVLFVIMVVIVSNMLQDEKIAMKYISELESVVESDGSLAADCCDTCVEYHNVFGD